MAYLILPSRITSSVRLIWLIVLIVVVACGEVEVRLSPQPPTNTTPAAYPAAPSPAPLASYPELASAPSSAYPAASPGVLGVEALSTQTSRFGEIQGKLLYQSDQTGSHHIYLQVDDEEPVPLAAELPLAVEGNWSPDGKTIAFVTQGIDSSNLVIQIMNADGSDKRLLTSVQPRLNWRPAWSRDGQQVLFISNRDGNFEIYRVNADGSDLVNITNNPANDLDPDWSSVMEKVVFVSNRGTGNGIYTMNDDGSEVTRLLSGEWESSYPRWSPDGNLIAFASAINGDIEIYVMNADGSGLRRVTDRIGDNVMPSWVNNDRLLFSGNFGDDTWDLYIINVDGSNMIQLTSQDRSQTYSERYPRWHP